MTGKHAGPRWGRRVGIGALVAVALIALIEILSGLIGSGE